MLMIFLITSYAYDKGYFKSPELKTQMSKVKTILIKSVLRFNLWLCVISFEI